MEIKIPYQFNLFLFITNLAEWHFSYRPHFNKVWRNQPTPFSPIEQNQLILFKKVLVKYCQKNNEHLTSFFASHENINWEMLTKTLNKKDIEIIKKTFSEFQPRFDFFYNRQKDNMSIVSELVKKNIGKNKSYLEQTKNLYDYKGKENCDILIALSENSNHGSGGMYFNDKGKGYIILQFGDFKLEEDNFPVLMVFYHELGHHFQKNNYWQKLTEKNKFKIKISNEFRKQGVDTGDIIDEPIHSALWGRNGIFTEKIFGFKKPATRIKGSYYYQLKLCVEKIKPLIKKYLDENKKADQELMNYIIKTWNGLN